MSVDQLRVQEEVKDMAEMSKKLLRTYKVLRLHPLHASQDDLNLGFKSRNTPAPGVFIYHSKYKYRPHRGLHGRTYKCYLLRQHLESRICSESGFHP